VNAVEISFLLYSAPFRRPCQQVIAMNPDEIAALIESGLPGANARVASDDNTHFEATIVAPQFEGKRMIQRHQLVYAALGERMGREIHALSIQAYAPSELPARPLDA